MFSGAPDRTPLPGNSRVPSRASPSASPIGAPPFDSSTSASQGSTSGVAFFFFFLVVSWHRAWVFVLLLILTIC